ncbi:MAG: peroxiredoxin-like family protein [Xanthobacteraceae bacterium]
MSVASSSLDDVFEQCCEMDASLAERLATFAEAVRTRRPAFSDAAERLVRRLRESGVGETAPKPGDLMPAFVLPDETGQLVSLEELLRRGPVAVTFHRGHWCPYCRISINALAKAHDVVIGDGGQIVAIIPERQQYATEFKTNGHISFPVLTDMDNGYAMSLNLTFWMGEEMKEIMRQRPDRDIAKFQGNESWMLPIPATFVVGRSGRISARFVDPDYRKRMAIDDLVAALGSAT